VIFGLWSLVYLTKHNDFQFHPFSCKRHNLLFFMAE
jgi:hypothetical protein